VVDERRTRTIAFPLIRPDLQQHRTESPVGDAGAQFDVRDLGA